MKIYPIITPCFRFLNKHNEPDAYSETNPAFFFCKEERKFKILVRMVNYRKYVNNAFCLSESKSRTIWQYFEISLDDLIKNGGVGMGDEETGIGNIVYIVNNYKKYDSYWCGVEDFRFVTGNLVIGVSPENNPNGGNPRMVLGLLDEKGEEITISNLLEPSVCEKNWLPFPEGENQHLVLYKVFPFEIKELLCNKFVYKMEDPSLYDQKLEYNLKGFHGSTNGINYEGGVLFLIHKSTGGIKTQHRWIWVDLENKIIKTSSKHFFFFVNSYIEFPCSLDMIDGEIYVSLGVNDNKAFIISGVSPPLLDETFELL